MLRGDGKQRCFQWHKEAEIKGTTETDGKRERQRDRDHFKPKLSLCAEDCLCGDVEAIKRGY